MEIREWTYHLYFLFIKFRYMKISKNVFCFDSILLQMYMYVSSKGGGGGAVLVFFFKFCVFFFLKGGGSKTEIMEEIWERDWQACRMNH